MSNSVSEGVNLRSVTQRRDDNALPLRTTGSAALAAVAAFGDEIAAAGIGGDTIDGTNSADSLAGAADGDSISGANGHDTLEGLAGDDLVRGQWGRDLLLGGEGDDSLNGGQGTDRLEGGAGNDTLTGSFDDDELLGGVGDDTYNLQQIGDQVIEAADEGVDLVRAYVDYVLPKNVENLLLVAQGREGTGNRLANAMTGSGAADTLSGNAGDDTLDGAAASDVMLGGAGDDVLLGGFGNDELRGGADNDRLDGGEDDDTLNGSAGNDTLIGGGDRDELTGGAGADLFVFTSIDDFSGVGTFGDRITDFRQADGDLIDLAAVLSTVAGGPDAFTFIGAADFSSEAGELRYEFIGRGLTVVFADLDGDGGGDFAFGLTGRITLVEADFVI